VFHRGAVTALAPEEPRVTDRLMGLVRKELVRPDRTQIAGDDAFRFRHLLIRDAAYDGLPKAVRADLHHRFADWLSANGGDLVELDEIVGYHLEQACRYRDELGLEHAPATAAAARERLKAAGRRALMREDLDAGTNLFQRSVSVDPASATDLGLHLDLAESLFERGQAADALRHLQTVEAERAAAGDRVGQLTVRIMRHRILLYVEPEGAAARLAALAQDALPELEAAGSDLGLYVAHLALGDAANIGAHTDVQARELQEAVEYARRFGQPHLLRQLDRESGAARLFGRTPADEILAWADDVAARRGRLLFMAAGARAVALAMQGYSDEARSLLDAVRERLSEQGADIAYALATGQIAPWIERLAGNRDRAAELGLEGSRLLEAAGERGWLSTTVGYRSVILAHLGQLEEAEAEARRAAALGSSDDAITQMLALQARGIVLAHRGGHEEAERLAREAVAIGETTDHIDGQADAWADLGTVLELAGRPAEAAAALERAAELYAAKGNVVCQERARAGIARLGAAPTP
jgi:tetratricopeptide (TPR) repeat protein